MCGEERMKSRGGFLFSSNFFRIVLFDRYPTANSRRYYLRFSTNIYGEPSFSRIRRCRATTTPFSYGGGGRARTRTGRQHTHTHKRTPNGTRTHSHDNGTIASACLSIANSHATQTLRVFITVTRRKNK